MSGDIMLKWSDTTSLLAATAMLAMLMNVYATKSLERKAILAKINTTSTHLPDIIHDNTQQPGRFAKQSVEVMTYLPVVLTWLLGFNRLNLDVYFASVAALYTARYICINLTVLPSVSDKCTDAPKTSAFHMLTHSCNDLSFSGHTVVILLHTYILAKLYPNWAPAWAVYAAVGAFMIPYVRNHYTTDVAYAAAVFVAVFLYLLQGDATILNG